MLYNDLYELETRKKKLMLVIPGYYLYLNELDIAVPLKSQNNTCLNCHLENYPY